MRAHGRKCDMRKRFAILIGVAASGVMAFGAQTGAATSEDVVTYDTEVGIYRSLNARWWVGPLDSRPQALKRCVVGREVIVFRKRPGPDRKLGATRSYLRHEGGRVTRWGQWKVRAPDRGRVYAKVTPKVGDGFVCRADYSRVVLNGRS